MASCPKCRQEWLWDWCRDIFTKPDGTSCREEVHRENGKNDGEDYYCDCGQHLGTLGREDAVRNEPEEWARIDWESENHSYEPYT